MPRTFLSGSTHIGPGRTPWFALVLTSAALLSVQGAAPTEEDDVDRTDFSEPHLGSDPKAATAPHEDIASTWIFPDSPDNKLPVSSTTDLVVAMANGGSKMFNVSHVVGWLLDADGKLALKLPRTEYGQALGPLEQRSLRIPLALDSEMAIGDYTLAIKLFYNTRDKENFVSNVLNETVELVHPPPLGGLQLLTMVQPAFGIAAVLLVGLLVSRVAVPSGDSKSKPGKKSKAGSKDGKAAEAAAGSEWLSGTLARTEKPTSKKSKKG